MRAAFLLPYPTGVAPGQRYRIEQWLGLLAPGAVDATILPLFSLGAYRHLYEPGGFARKGVQTAAALTRRVVQAVTAARADVVVLYREAFPFGPGLIEGLLERRVPLVYDFDDAIWLGETSAANAWAQRLKSPGKVGDIIAGAATTTVGNEYLARYARHYSAAVQVIPTTVDTDRYRPPPEGARSGPEAGGTRLVRIGWSGSRTTSRHLASIDGALRRMLDELPIELVVIGDPAFRLSGSSYADRVRVEPWRPETEIAEVGAFDVGLMPLPDDEWSRGKCGFKALLYMSLGVPPVVAPVGVNTEIVQAGVNGLTASSEEEWVEEVAKLVEDAALRRSLGVAARQTVVERYSGRAWAPRFLGVLEAAAAGGPGGGSSRPNQHREPYTEA
ncbi:MAG TPA: glycosyltransferase [Actinomycetota bacterium]|nr:glycosyltransferase [Actinomycetota bacterium]